VNTPGQCLPGDIDARRQATQSFDSNLVVLAGAGTGKTALLVERALTALATGRVEPAHLAAITFTEKAAGEMLQRLAAGLEQLRRLARGERPADGPGRREAESTFTFLTEVLNLEAEAIARRTLAALQQLERMRITTIHGFCSDLLRLYPRQAGVDPEFVVDPGQHLEALLDGEWDLFLEEELGPGAPRPDLWRRLLGAVPLTAVESAARRLASFGLAAELLAPHFECPDTRQLFGEETRELLSELEEFLRHRGNMADATRHLFEGIHAATAAHERDGVPGLLEVIRGDPDLAARIDSGKPLRKTGLGKEFNARLAEIGERSLRLLKTLAAVDDELVSTLLEAIAPFGRRIREQSLARGLVSYDGLLTLARDLLRDHPRVREEIRQRIRFLLVDEFQDTDPVQYEIVLFLAEEDGGAAGDPYEARLAPGRLFIVGDPKQSIYRFRGADYSAFRRAVARVQAAGGRELTLTENFRSRPGVIEPINALFNDDRNWSPSDYQPTYVPIQAHKEDAGPQPAVELWTVEAGEGADATRRRRAEGEVIAREIRRLVDDKKAEFRQFTLLFRSFSNLAIYLRPLRRHGIRFIVDGGKEFLERPEVGHLLALLQALGRPHDPVALLAFLRSPAGAVTDTELAAHAAGGGSWSWLNGPLPDASRFPHLDRAFRLLRRLAGDVRDLPADGVIRHVLNSSPLPVLEAAAFEGAQRLANLRKLAAAATGLARDGSLSLPEVLDTILEVRGSDIEGDSPLNDEQTDAVKVLTIHKAKGLENDIVLLPDLAREEGRGSWESTAVEVAGLPDGRQSLAVEIHGTCNGARVWFKREHARHEEAEELRVLYVATTRAKERLILVAGASRRKARWISTLAAWGYDRESVPEDGDRLVSGRVLHRRLAPARTADARAEPVAMAGGEATAAYHETVAKLRNRSHPFFLRPSGAESDLLDDGQAVSGHQTDSTGGGARVLSADKNGHPARSDGTATGGGGHGAPCRDEDLARGTGLLAHRLLELWDGSDRESLLAPLEKLASLVAAQVGVSSDALAGDARQVMERFLRSDLAVRLDGMEVLARELPLLLQSREGPVWRGMQSREGPVWRGSIDLLAREADGSLLVVDHKTDRDPVDEALRRRYGPQMAVYAEAIRRAFSLTKPPRAELWLLRAGRAVVVDAAPEIARLKLDPAGG